MYEGLTLSFVYNPKFLTKREVIKSVRYEDGESGRGRSPKFHGQKIPVSELISDDEGNVATIGCIRLGKSKFLLIEQNGYNVSRDINAKSLTAPANDSSQSVRPLLMTLMYDSSRRCRLCVATGGILHYNSLVQENMKWNIDDSVWKSIFEGKFDLKSTALTEAKYDTTAILTMIANVFGVTYNPQWVQDTVQVVYGRWMPYEPEEDEVSDDVPESAEEENETNDRPTIKVTAD